MHYFLRVDTLSGLQAARVGHEGYSLSLTRWEVRPEPNTKGETEDVALRKGSAFYQSILGTAPDTTLTFWVYPDSFPIFRKLQKFAHEHGYSVAGRPLPHGLHIAGSPEGSPGRPANKGAFGPAPGPRGQAIRSLAEVAGRIGRFTRLPLLRLTPISVTDGQCHVLVVLEHHL